MKQNSLIFGFLAIFAFVFEFSEALIAQTAPVKNVVLVRGGFVDGSGWEGVYKLLKKDGYTVAVVQNPTISLATTRLELFEILRPIPRGPLERFERSVGARQGHWNKQGLHDRSRCGGLHRRRWSEIGSVRTAVQTNQSLV
jgi:hypothetical protein